MGSTVSSSFSIVCASWFSLWLWFSFWFWLGHLRVQLRVYTGLNKLDKHNKHNKLGQLGMWRIFRVSLDHTHTHLLAHSLTHSSTRVHAHSHTYTYVLRESTSSPCLSSLSQPVSLLSLSHSPGAEIVIGRGPKPKQATLFSAAAAGGGGGGGPGKRENRGEI